MRMLRGDNMEGQQRYEERSVLEEGTRGVRGVGSAFSCESAGAEIGVFAARILRLASGVWETGLAGGSSSLKI